MVQIRGQEGKKEGVRRAKCEVKLMKRSRRREIVAGEEKKINGKGKEGRKGEGGR